VFASTRLRTPALKHEERSLARSTRRRSLLDETIPAPKRVAGIGKQSLETVTLDVLR
jgi:hypothetical protein